MRHPNALEHSALVMSKSITLFIFYIALHSSAFAQARALSAQSLADQALVKARSGRNAEALTLYRQALAEDPGNQAILRDYAVVLGWSEQYHDAISVINNLRTLENDQPVWALQEFARSYLFDGAATDALSMLNELVERGDSSESTLTRKGLALRWLGRPAEAIEAYRRALALYPNSADATVGIAYSLADENKLSKALESLDSPQDLDNDVQVMKARIRILNWMGRHYEAQRMLARIPTDRANDRGVLEDRIAAARWGGNPVEAGRDLITLSSMFPGDSSSRLLRDFRTEFGNSVTPSVRYADDSDGLIDRTAAMEAMFHLNPAHAIRVGYQYRILEQQQPLDWKRFELGWTGTVHRRLTFYTTVSGIEYEKPLVDRKVIGDGSVTFVASDKLRFSGGGGSVMMDAYNAVRNEITAPFGFGEVRVSPTSATWLQARYSRYRFTDNVNRDRVDLELTHAILAESPVRLNVGWRSNLMRHDAQTDDFYSPSRFQSHLVALESNGRIAPGLDFSAEIAGGWQLEPATPVLHPLQVAGKLQWHPLGHWTVTLEAGRSTSSLDRPSSGVRTYNRRAFSAGIQSRFP
jgi:tetratricopeptide (TPR) repeat protein